MTAERAIEKYVPKHLQEHVRVAIPLPTTSRLTKKIEELEAEIKDLETRLERMGDADAIIKYLEAFKEQFTFHCVSEGHDITILYCSRILSLGACTMKNVCKPRLALGKKLNYL